jgi:hypothetical protein
MQTAYIHLIKYALGQGYTVSVWDGEEWQVKRSKDRDTIIDAVKSVEEAQLRIRDQDGNIVGWALVSAYDLQPEETVMDYGVNEWMESWYKGYCETTEA